MVLRRRGRHGAEVGDGGRCRYDYHFSAHFDGGAGEIEERSAAYQHLTREVLRAQRETLLSMRDEERISDEAMHRVEREPDLEEPRLEI